MLSSARRGSSTTDNPSSVPEDGPVEHWEEHGAPSTRAGAGVPSLDFTGLSGSPRIAAASLRAAGCSPGASVRGTSLHRLSESTSSMDCSSGAAGPPRIPDSAMDQQKQRGGGGRGSQEKGWAAARPHGSSCDGDAGAGCSLLDPSGRLLFTDAALHLLMLRLVLELAVTETGSLNPHCWTQYPLDNGHAHNLEYLLMWHMSNGGGAALLPRLLAKLAHAPSPTTPGGAQPGRGSQTAAASKASGCRRLLQLLCRGAFDDGRFTELKHHARGAMGDIFQAKMAMPRTSTGAASGAGAPAPAGPAGGAQQIVIKTVSLPMSAYDRCVLPDIFGEIDILERYRGCTGICQVRRKTSGQWLE